MRESQESIGDPGLDEVLSQVRLAEGLDYEWIGRLVVAASIQPTLEKIVAKNEDHSSSTWKRYCGSRRGA